MNRNEILDTLKDFPFDPREYWIITGAAMVLYGMREEAGDIDLGCTAEMADALENGGHLLKRTENGKRRFRYGDRIEIFEDWRTGPTEKLGGYNVLSPEGLIAMKEQLGREKDMRDIGLIVRFLEEKRTAETKEDKE